MIDAIFINAFLASIGISMLLAIIGCLLIWKDMSYFGHSVGHGSFLGISLALYFEINESIGILAIILILAILLLSLQRLSFLSPSTLLIILAHSAFAISILIISLGNINSNINSYLFGNILTITDHKLIIIYSLLITITIILTIIWKPLIIYLLNKELAISENINTQLIEIIVIAITTFSVAVAIKLVGILLITSLLIIPSTLTRYITKTPKSMMIWAVIISGILSVIGTYSSIQLNTPTSATIVVLLFICFLGINIIYKLTKD